MKHTVFIQTPYTKENKAEPYDKNKKWGYVLFTNSEYGEKLGNELWNYLEKEKY